MKRSVYSLVLMDDVIKAVDEQAYRLGTSRSNLINQILAERLSCVTPEMRMREIFDSMTELIGGAFRIQQQRSASLMTLVFLHIPTKGTLGTQRFVRIGHLPTHEAMHGGSLGLPTCEPTESAWRRPIACPPRAYGRTGLKHRYSSTSSY